MLPYKYNIIKTVSLGLAAAASVSLLSSVISNYFYAVDIKYNQMIAQKENLIMVPDKKGGRKDPDDLKTITLQLHSKSNEELFFLENADKPCNRIKCLSVSDNEVTKFAGSIRKNRLEQDLLKASQQQAQSAIFTAALAVFSLFVSVIGLFRPKSS